MNKLIQGFEVVIGFETHAQLSTQSKIFSRAATAFGAEPNTQACAVDLALPAAISTPRQTGWPQWPGCTDISILRIISRRCRR